MFKAKISLYFYNLINSKNTTSIFILRVLKLLLLLPNYKNNNIIKKMQ